jgi:hypothetical protein
MDEAAFAASLAGAEERPLSQTATTRPGLGTDAKGGRGPCSVGEYWRRVPGGLALPRGGMVQKS